MEDSQSLYSLIRCLVGSEQLAWALHWILTATVAVGLVGDVAQPRQLFAEGGGAGDGHAADHALSLHVRHDGAGDSGGVFGPHRAQGAAFRQYELAALGACAVALIFSFIFMGAPVGLGATLIVAALIVRRAGPWWRREPAPSLVASAA